MQVPILSMFSFYVSTWGKGLKLDYESLSCFFPYFPKVFNECFDIHLPKVFFLTLETIVSKELLPCVAPKEILKSLDLQNP